MTFCNYGTKNLLIVISLRIKVYSRILITVPDLTTVYTILIITATRYVSKKTSVFFLAETTHRYTDDVQKKI